MNKIAILLCTYNGEKYLKEQIESLMNQTCKDFIILARDDKSSDKSIDILRSYGIKVLEAKENLGAKGSFAELLGYALENTQCKYFMFCDQDDVWKSDKIEKTLKKMELAEKKYGNIPLLVHSDLEVVDENLKIICDSFWEYENLNPKINRFNRLLIQNTVTGCTTMINKELAEKSINIPDQAIMHDWWIALTASYLGKIEILEDKTVLYRQHGNNTVGAKRNSKVQIIKHAVSLLLSIFRRNDKYIKALKMNIDQAKAFLIKHEDNLTEDNKKMLEDFSGIEGKGFFEKRKILLKNKLFKQGIPRNAGLFIKI